MIEIVIILLILLAIGICVFMKCIIDLNKYISELEKKIYNLQYQADDILCDINIVNENVLNTDGLLSRKKVRNEEVE